MITSRLWKLRGGEGEGGVPGNIPSPRKERPATRCVGTIHAGRRAQRAMQLKSQG